MLVPDNADFPGLSEPIFLRTGDCPLPVPIANVENETGDRMHQPNHLTIDESVTTFLRTTSGANKSAATIIAYRRILACSCGYAPCANSPSADPGACPIDQSTRRASIPGSGG
jgi:hypothetical protein